MNFPDITDEEFQNALINILELTNKNSTYKFAFMRFLQDYSNEYTETHVEYSTIAEYYFKYYWMQECKSKLKQSAQEKPTIIEIIRKEFDKDHYPQTVQKIIGEEPEKIQRCIKEIKKKVFKDVVWRFQELKEGRGAKEYKIFFDYKITGTNTRTGADKVTEKYPDLNAGIDINPKAIVFFKKNNILIKKAVNLEWARYLEKLNLGVPKLIQKTEGENIARTSLVKYRKVLKPFFKNCFYCQKQLSKKETHVEHVIPFDYIAEDNICNLTLACQKCNCSKLGSLPPEKSLEQLISRNSEYRNKIPMLKKSLAQLGVKPENVIREHYNNAKLHGYRVLKKIPE